MLQTNHIPIYPKNKPHAHLPSTIAHLSHFLPTQAHIKDFVHHNTLHAFQKDSFHSAIARANRMYKAKCYLPIKEYQSLFDSGQMTEDGINLALKINKFNFSSDEFKKNLNQYESYITSNIYLENNSLHQLRDLKFNTNLTSLTKPIMIRLSNHFFDQGIAVRGLPHQNETFWHCIQKLTQNSFLPLIPFNQSLCKDLIKLNYEEALQKALYFVVGKEELYESYIWELMMILPGWAGFVNEVEKNPKILPSQRHVSLAEWITVLLLIEVGFIEKTIGKKHVSLTYYTENSPKYLEVSKIDPFPILCHESVEWSRYLHFLQKIKQNSSLKLKNKSQNLAKVQAVFCIDDRYFTLRYFLEKKAPDIATYSGPGFFGIDCLVTNESLKQSEKQCPVPVNPQNILIKKPSSKKNNFYKPFISPHSHSQPIGEWLRTHLQGIPSGVNILLGILYPEFLQNRRISEEIDHSLVVWCSDISKDLDKKKIQEGYKIGFSFEEASDRVINFLKSIGLTKNFSRLIAIVAHGASSVNNPYFAAYDCGACSGRPGAINAKAFCIMANNPNVRQIIAKKGLIIPQETIFIPFIHDTTADKIDRLSDLPSDETSKKYLSYLEQTFEEALNHNAQARCKKFASLHRKLSFEQARKYVHRRAIAWYEPRPEYNHATNFACVIGKRQLTENLYFDHNIFLQSYDYEEDKDGAILEKILLAVIPVCGGINLEYFFSRIDPDVYGAGSKLPQNIAGLFGVMTGFESDLRTGLPTQMTDIHDPLRLILVIEQTTDLTASIIERSLNLGEWLNGDWIWLVCQDPRSQCQFLYRHSEVQKWLPI